ncbi:ribosome biogenesis GTPase YlqF [Desulfurispora thermophila]|uniref:ribosome biogenesis GTPase YlqF n=1 Tax=Desulfurispora thermophila TaxID=265470 RepID=UPI00035F42B8|nr:ribosome biogenesis GTPase YlqF [Desulfurispora thermophila]
MQIQWYPGHMARARRQVQENLKLVDVAIELLDARIPLSSRNPDIDAILQGYPRLVVLNKADLADPAATAAWREYFTRRGHTALAVDSQRGSGTERIPAAVARLAAPKMAALAARGRRPRPPRCLIVGVPNVGKSSLLNRLAGRKATRTADRPGVTRGPQWVRLPGAVELLDTPGILWPKFTDPAVGLKLALTGAIKEELYNVEECALRLIDYLLLTRPPALADRYGPAGEGTTAVPAGEAGGVPGDVPAGVPDDPWPHLLQSEPSAAARCWLAAIGKRRGLLLPGGRPDPARAAVQLLRDFREGKLGRFTLELCDQ